MEDTVMIEVIKKAIRNGWRGQYNTDVIAKGNDKVAIKSAMGLIGRGTVAPLYSIIFNHSFAKAFFSYEDTTEKWKEHLQEMALEENPVEYLKKYL